MKRINGSDETHDRESLPLSHGRWIMIRRSRWSHVVVRYKTHRNAWRLIAIGRIRCIFRDLISTVIPLCDRRLRFIAIRWTRFSHVSPLIKWRSTIKSLSSPSPAFSFFSLTLPLSHDLSLFSPLLPCLPSSPTHARVRERRRKFLSFSLSASLPRSYVRV